MIIESDDSIADLLQMVLDDEGYEVLTCLPELEDPDAISQRHPDLFLFDVDSVRGTWSISLDQLSSHPATHSVPVLCLATRPGADDLLSRQNVVGVLTLPFDVEDLLLAVQRVT